MFVFGGLVEGWVSEWLRSESERSSVEFIAQKTVLRKHNLKMVHS